MDMSNAPLSYVDEVLRPIEKAKGLPNEHYTNDAVFAEERHAVLFDNWSAISFGKDIPKSGDAKPINFVDMPLIIVRNNDGNINVFQNTCRHRGMILIDKPTQLNNIIRCPYHSWCYDLNGKICATPMVGGTESNNHEAVNYDELGLYKIRSYVWQDIIFVNISGNATEFVDYASKALNRWAEFDKPIFHGGKESHFTLEVKTNWKLAIENYCESYHLPFVHPGLNDKSKIEDHYHIQEPDCFSGQGSYSYNQIKTEDGDTFPDFKGLSSKWDSGSEYIAFYPNVLLGVHRDHIYSIIVEPISTDKSIEHVSIYYAKRLEEMSELKSLIKSNAKFWKSVFLEDVFVVEGMQRGRKGLIFDGGKFSPVMDNPTHCFHQWVAKQIINFRS